MVSGTFSKRVMKVKMENNWQGKLLLESTFLIRNLYTLSDDSVCNLC